MPADFLVAHGADPKRWAARHGIEPFTVACESCGRPKTTSIPMAAADGRRGLLAPRCACSGTRYRLGEPHPEYRDWLREHVPDWDPSHPLKVVDG